MFDPEKVERLYVAEDYAGDYYFRLNGIPMMDEGHRRVFDYSPSHAIRRIRE